MNTKRKKLEIAFICIFLAFLAVLYTILFWKTAVRTDRDLRDRLKGMNVTYVEAAKNARQNRKILDGMEERAARMALYYLKHRNGTVKSSEILDELCEALSADAVFLTDSKGTVLDASSGGKLPALTKEQMSSLISLSDAGDVSVPVLLERAEDDDSRTEAGEPETKEAGEGTCLISVCPAPGQILMICTDRTEFLALQEETMGWAEILSDNTIGSSELSLAVYEDGTVACMYPAHGAVPETLEDAGGRTKILRDGWKGSIRLKGERYIGRTVRNEACGVYLVACVEAARIHAAVLFRLLLIAIPVLVMVVVLYRYGCARLQGELPGDVVQLRAGIPGRTIGAILSLMMIVTLLSCVYAEELNYYASQARANAETMDAASAHFNEIDQLQESGKAVYLHYAGSLTHFAAVMASQDPSVRSSRRLEELAALLGVSHILIYDRDGTVTASDRNYTGLSLSDNPEDLSYEFRWVLYGNPFLIQEEVDGKYLNEPFRFAGVPLIAENGSYDGLVQLAFDEHFQEQIVRSVSLREMLGEFSGEAASQVFVVEKDSGIMRSTNPDWDGISAGNLGLTDKEMHSGFAGFFRLPGRRLFGCCTEGEIFYTFAASRTENVFLVSVINGLICGVPAMLVLLLTVLILYRLVREADSEEANEEAALPDGEKGGAARIILHSAGAFLGEAWIAVSALFSLLFLLRSLLFGSNTLLHYLLNVDWAKGLDVLSFTRCLIDLGVISFVGSAALGLLRLLGRLLPPKEQTFLGMISSFSRYVFVICAIYFCADRLGAPAHTLFASVGIATLVIGFGAQTIVADILSGLFIIFENMYQVGDVIKVNNWRGQVLEIGVRNTKILDLEDNNVKIMNNSQVKMLTNYSRMPTFCNLAINIRYDGDLREIEDFIRGELPSIRQGIPAITGPIQYLGAGTVTAQTAVLRFRASCESPDFGKVCLHLEKDLTRTLHKNHIQVEKTEIK